MPPALAQWPRFDSQQSSTIHVCFLLSLTYLYWATRASVCVIEALSDWVRKGGAAYVMAKKLKVLDRWQEIRPSVTKSSHNSNMEDLWASKSNVHWWVTTFCLSYCTYMVSARSQELNFWVYRNYKNTSFFRLAHGSTLQRSTYSQ